jgi:hypothetical protein
MTRRLDSKRAALATFGAAALTCLAAAPALATPYTIQAFIPIPSTLANVQPGKAFTSFDISYFDPVTRLDYVADRSNASVDIISAATRTVVGQAQGFTGQQATTSVSGADGVVTVTSGGVSTLYAGDGNSTLKVFNVTAPGTPSLLQNISTGGSFRVDEMAYSPLTHQLLAANNADAPAFATIFSTASPPVTIAHANIKIPGAANTDGMEQPVWNPNTGTFFVSIPAFNGDKGGVAEIKTDGTIGRLFKFATMAGAPATCSPTGLALGASGNLMVGCGGSAASGAQAVLLNPAGNGNAGSIVKTFAISGTDEIWYDPTSGNYFVTGADGSGNRVFDVISDSTNTVIQSVLLPVSSLANPHSISVDPVSGDVYVPLAGNTAAVGGSACALGCIAVFGVPEPGTLPVLLFGGVLMLGLGAHRRGPHVGRSLLGR